MGWIDALTSAVGSTASQTGVGKAVTALQAGGPDAEASAVKDIVGNAPPIPKLDSSLVGEGTSARYAPTEGGAAPPMGFRDYLNQILKR